MALGDWLYPNKSEVGILKFHPNDGFYRNRDRSVVRLHWRENFTEVIGQFCCKVPDATSNLITICINVSNSGNDSSPGLVSGDESCNPTSTATEQPVTSTTRATDHEG